MRVQHELHLHYSTPIANIRAKRFILIAGSEIVDGHSAWVRQHYSKWTVIDNEVERMCEQNGLHEMKIEFMPT